MNKPLDLAKLRIGRYLQMREEKPLRSLGEPIHAIHTGTQWAAELMLADVSDLFDECKRLRAENARLREALEYAMQIMYATAGNLEFVRNDENVNKLRKMIEQARAALAKDKP